jgi:serine/threonine-protein kinase
MLTAGEKFSRYKVISAIGAGGMGEVYLAEDSRLNRRIALKILPENLAADSDRLRRFEQEARAVSALNHPNILTIYEFGAENKTHFLASEFIKGTTLREKLQSRLIDLTETLDIAVQIVSALEAAHSAGIIHRDIKPENVMIREDGIVKVLDFGLAKLSEPPVVADGLNEEAETQMQTEAGVVMGTVAYMSPEQARARPVNAQTDIFSFGIVLYEMVTRKQPFTGETINHTIVAILEKEPPPLSEFAKNYPPEIERIIFKALAKNKDERYQSAKDLLVDLKNLQKRLEFEGTFGALPTDGDFRYMKPAQTETQIAEAETQVLEAAKTNEEKPSTGKTPSTKRAFVLGLIILLFTAAGLGGYWFLANRSTNQIESIAVLPFINESGNADTEYLSDGMTETLISSLSQLPNLNVKARSTVFRYKGKETNANAIGKELNVQAILLGRVVQRGEQLRLSLELVDARTENIIWSEQYNRKQADLISLQNEIARDVSGKLSDRLKTTFSGADEQRLTKNYTANAEAYQLYLRGRFYWNKRTGEGLQKSIEFFNQAIEKDPKYALAYAGLADTYAVLPNYYGAIPSETMPKAREAATTALGLDNNLAEAHNALGQVLYYYDYNLDEAEREYKQAIELNPNYATAHQWYGELLVQQGRTEEGFAEFRRALEIDPLSLAVNLSYGFNLYNARKYDESIAQLKKTLELDNNFATVHIGLASVYWVKRDSTASVNELAKFYEVQDGGKTSELIRESFAEGGWEGFLRAMTGTRRPPNIPSYSLAIYYAELGEKDKAFAELNNSYDKREWNLVLLKVDPLLDPLRDDPRFQDLMRRVGFTP